MRFLLDTHTLFWWFYKPHRLSETARATIIDRRNEILVSAVSAFEVSNKHRRGKWDEVAPHDSVDVVEDAAALNQHLAIVEHQGGHVGERV